MKKKITDIADIQLGYQFRKKIESADNGTNRVIQIRDFDENHILNKEFLFRVRIDKPVEKYLINKGDVLFLSRGHRNWAAPIVDDLTATIAVSHFFVIRPKQQNVLPEYLAWYINQTPAQEYLHKIARRGTHMPLIPLSAFWGLTVTLPDIETQKKIVEVSRLMEKEKQILFALQGKRSQLINAICLKAAKTKKEK
jgi:restriction endonuclease S subunit